METTINKIMKNAWLVLGIIILILIPFYGAWHHLFTVGICAIMYAVFKGEEDKDSEKEIHE